MAGCRKAYKITVDFFLFFLREGGLSGKNTSVENIYNLSPWHMFDNYCKGTSKTKI